MASPLELRARRLEKAHEDFLTASREYDLFHVAVRSDEVESMACLDGLSDARLSDAFVELFEPLPTEHRRGQAVDAFGSLAYHYGQRPWIKSHAAAFWQSSLNRHPKDSTARIVREQQKDIPIPGSGTKKPSLETLQTFVWRELVFRIGGVKELQGQPSVHSGKGGRCRMIYYGRDYRDYVFSPHCVSQFFRLVRQAADDFEFR